MHVCVCIYTDKSTQECAVYPCFPVPFTEISSTLSPQLYASPFQTYKTGEHTWGKEEFLQTPLMFHRLDFCGFFPTSFSGKQGTK